MHAALTSTRVLSEIPLEQPQSRDVATKTRDQLAGAEFTLRPILTADAFAAVRLGLRRSRR
jgi:hypothetical protein